MLTGLTKAMRNWMAMGFIAFYALCVLAPTAALAFNEVSCLTETGKPQSNSHAGDAAHDHGAPHSHSGPTDTHDEGSASSQCCGMIFCSALVPESEMTLAPAALSHPAFAGINQAFAGLSPDKLIRPPKFQS